MNTRAMVARLNNLDGQLCSAFGIFRSGDATTLDEARKMITAVNMARALVEYTAAA